MPTVTYDSSMFELIEKAEYDRLSRQDDENDALRARLAEADAAVRAFVAWLEHDDTHPAYPPGTNRDSPGNEAIWQEWWDEANQKCAVALNLGRAYVRGSDNGSVQPESGDVR